VKTIQPYTAGIQPAGSGWTKLNTNENPFPPSPRAIEAMRNADFDKLRLYSDPDSKQLATAIAKNYGVDVSEVFCGNSSDEVIALAYQAFFTDKKNVLMPDISYGFFPVWASAYGVDMKTVPLRSDYTINPADYKNAGGVIVANPNAPTGILLSLADIETLAKNNPKGIVIIDEAYADFTDQPSALTLINKYPNLLITRTFSKSYSLAGLRVGFAIGNADLIKTLHDYKNAFNAYPLDMIAQLGAAAAISDTEYFEKTRREIMQTRDWLATQINCLPSSANFVLCSVADGQALYDYLVQNKILVRYFPKPRLENYLRVSIGTRKEMEEFVKCVNRFSNERQKKQ
jgi:histidinol-phosphate aminotransferase